MPTMLTLLLNVPTKVHVIDLQVNVSASITTKVLPVNVPSVLTDAVTPVSVSLRNNLLSRLVEHTPLLGMLRSTSVVFVI